MTRRLLLPSACGFALLIASASAVAQAPATTAPAPAAGLQSLSDDRLIAELANRGMTSLLDRAFEVNRVPPQQREGMRTLIALRQLAEPRLTAAQREQLIASIVKGIEQALPGLNDPKLMMQQATTLLQHGVEREVNTLEYWGETARSQAPLRPTVEAVIKLLEKAAGMARKEADDLANQITGPTDPRAARWEELDGIASAAMYTRHMVDYYLALSMDRVASQQRREVAQQGIEYLAQFDNPDSAVQPVVRNRIAKLRMVRDELEQAKDLFATVARPAPEIQPPPDASQQWEARYFSAVCDLLGQDLAAAQAALDALITWQQAKLPKDKQTQDGAAAAAAMLQYRIHSLAAEIAKDPAAKQKANDQAVGVLLDLVKRRPDLQPIIFRQLLAKLPADVDLKTLDPLLLQGFVARADEERQRPAAEQADAKALQRGIDAAREVLRRHKAGGAGGAGGGVDPQLAETNALLIGFFLDRLGQHAAAANALLDYLADFAAHPQNATIALDHALAIIGRLRANPATADEPATVRAYERVLPIAIKPPFLRREFAYEYARRLQLTGKAKEAVEYFRQVPADDKRLASARFFEMVALQQRLDEEKLAPAERQQVISELQRMVDDVATRVSAGMNAATSEPEKLQYRSMLVRTLLLSADVARREQNDPKRTLKLLERFESLAAGLANERELVGNVLYTRVQAYMALGDSNAATQTLVALLKSKPGGEGAAVVYKLLQKLNEELDHARLAGQRDRMQVLAKNRAALSGFLVEWSRTNPDPNINKFTYRYSVFDAATKHLAADLETDPAQRRAGLEGALKLYRNLESPESLERYRATLEANSPDRAAGDPAVALGIGLIAFDLGDDAEAQRRLGQLLTDRRLGTPTIAVQEEGGQTRITENDQYWEATLKLMQSNVALGNANPSDAAAQAAKNETINYLKQLYVRWGRDIGGKKWSPEFEKLRARLIPDFNPADVAPETTQPASTTTTTTTATR